MEDDTAVRYLYSLADLIDEDLLEPFFYSYVDSQNLTQVKRYDLSALQGYLLYYLVLFLNRSLSLFNDLRYGFRYLNVHPIYELALQSLCKLCSRKHGNNRCLFNFFVLSQKYFLCQINKHNELDLSSKLFCDNDDFDNNYNDISKQLC